jgi:hypothetical protein
MYIYSEKKKKTLLVVWKSLRVLKSHTIYGQKEHIVHIFKLFSFTPITVSSNGEQGRGIEPSIVCKLPELIYTQPPC